MRRAFGIAVVLAASVTLVLPGQAQQSGQPGQFYGGMTPQNLQFKPVNVGNAMKPIDFSKAMMPQTQSSKVFNISQAFHKINMPLFRSTAPTTPAARPGKNNPLQPTLRPLGTLPSVTK